MVQQLVSQQALLLKEEYGHLEKDMNIDIYDHPQRAPTVMTVESQTKLLTLLSTLPHGVIKWSHAVPGTQPLPLIACWGNPWEEIACPACNIAEVTGLSVNAGSCANPVLERKQAPTLWYRVAPNRACTVSCGNPGCGL